MELNGLITAAVKKRTTVYLVFKNPVLFNIEFARVYICSSNDAAILSLIHKCVKKTEIWNHLADIDQHFRYKF